MRTSLAGALLGLILWSGAPAAWEERGNYPDYRRSVLPAPAQMAADLGGCLLHFSLTPKADGTLQGMTAARMQEMTAGAPCAILVIGGAGRSSGFRSAPINTLVANVVKAAAPYDGVDVDWEPLNNWDDERAKVAGEPTSGRWQPFMRVLAGALPSGKRLSIDVGYPFENNKNRNLARMIADVAPLVDRVHLMAYSFAGPWPGWVSWPGSALFNGGKVFPSAPTKPLPSIELMVSRYAAAGVSRSKMMLGIPFFCREWQGVHGPMQGWEQGEEPWIRTPEYQYKTAIVDYANVPRRWDSVTKTPWWSINQPNKRRYLTCDDQQSIRLKRQWAQDNGLAGMFVWELSGGPLSLLR
jgi:GH18 family chitinase